MHPKSIKERLNPSNIFRTARNEAIVSLVVGTAPCFIAYHSGGAALLEKFIVGVAPDGALLWYTAALTIAYLILGFLFWFLYIPHGATKNLLRLFVSVFRESGKSLHGILRVATGALIGIVLLVALYESHMLNTGKILFFSAYALTGVIECTFLYFIHEAFEKEFRTPSL